jgi:hypothetical protein
MKAPKFSLEAPHALTSPPPSWGRVREGEAAFRWETIIARFPHLDPPPCWGRRKSIERR